MLLMAVPQPTNLIDIHQLSRSLASTGSIVSLIQYHTINIDGVNDYMLDILYTINQLYIENNTVVSTIYNMVSNNINFICIQQLCQPTLYAINSMYNTMNYTITVPLNIQSIMILQPIIPYTEQSNVINAIQSIASPITSLLLIDSSNCITQYQSYTLPLYTAFHKTNKIFLALNSEGQCNVLMSPSQLSNILIPYIQYTTSLLSSTQYTLFTAYQLWLQELYTVGAVQLWYQNYQSNHTYYGSMSI